MGKQQVWSVTAYVFLFLSLASQIHCKSHINSIRRVSLSSTQTTTSDVVKQQEPKEKDLIKKLPGQPPVSFRQYGGYVAVNETAGRFFYYYFVEAINATASTPLVLWLNGGPGCSSLGRGALLMHGPFRVHSDGETLYRNPYAFNNEANMLYLESPAQTGFSYTNTPSELTSQWDDKAAEDNYVFLVKWLERFPEFKGRELYMAGQSFAGHYVPKLAQIVLKRNKQTFINLRGLFLGNPSLDGAIEAEADNTFLAGHAMIPQKYLDDYLAFDVNTEFDVEKFNVVISKIEAQKKNVDLYNIYAPQCRNATLTSKPKKGTSVMVYEPCSDSYVTAYLNRRKVQEAIHVKSSKIPYVWQHCNSNVFYSWNQTDVDAPMSSVLHEILGQGVRIFVYSGDFDMVIPVTATMQVIKNMNLTIQKPWRQWFSGGQVGGFTEEYKGNLTFATVRAAGHSVASDQPIRAFTTFTSFIRNKPLPSTL